MVVIVQSAVKDSMMNNGVNFEEVGTPGKVDHEQAHSKREAK
jgi:hypothetical protein